MSYTNKTALIIGGSHGIGLSTAQLGPATKVIPCDITSLPSISTLVDTASSFFGTGRTIDLLFINAGYAASKAALHSFVQTLAAELVGAQVRVNAVSPGFVKTPTMGVVGASREELVEFEGQGVKGTPMGRIADPAEVAKAVVFLGFEATFTTGEQVVVDGGLATLRLH
ncbi:hypothetical protein Aspvir_003308 [Aspergillus viridinutans]|uniref:Uncharacterized protein n=1 Tax=Aspergillus viridinutans TaxID=75553 RepID=A0A9P3C4X0_ASPVI|nr:uncharacterized protein Aspvir_003308 [Aspergillus viridinutans]GIK07642.1 hypothetical protein Aspvir_003308 [Aspergillus viridinutans]